MAFINRLFGRKKVVQKRAPASVAPVPEAKPEKAYNVIQGKIKRQFGAPRPAEVKQFDRIGLLLAYVQDDMNVIIDCDSYEYAFNESKGPRPLQKDLDALWPKVTRVCVLKGFMARGKIYSSDVLIDTGNPQAIQSLAESMRIVEELSSLHHCSCLGGPSIELYAGHELIASIGIHHGQSLRWKQWHDDAPLSSGERLTEWLIDHGIKRENLKALYERDLSFIYQGSPPLPSHTVKAEEYLAESQMSMKHGNPQQALRQCDEAIRHDPEHRGAHAMRGYAHYHLGQYKEALSDFTSSIRLGFRCVNVFYTAGMLLIGNGQMEAGAAYCSHALHYDPQHAGAYLQRGIARSNLNKLNEAFEDYSIAIRLLPHLAMSYMHRGLLQHQRGQLTAAVTDLDKAVESLKAEPNQMEAQDRNVILSSFYARRGNIKLDQFRESDAEADFALARETHPAAGLSYLGEIWMRRYEHKKAIEVFDQYLVLQPLDVSAWLNRGLAREILKDLEGASADYTEALRLKDENTSCYILRARVRLQQDRLADALLDVNEHLRRYPSDSFALLLRSKILQNQGSYFQSLQDKNAALEVAPEQPDICNSLAWFLATCPDDKYRDGKRAVTLAQRACNATENKNSHFIDTLAAALAEAGEFEEAVRMQTIAVEMSTQEQAASRRARIDLYRSGKAHREEPGSQSM